VIINSLTKIGAIPGLRLGFMIASSEIINEMGKHLEQWNINRLAQKVLSTILKQHFLKKTVTHIKRENFWLVNQLNDIPHLKVWPWDANFYLVMVDNKFSAAEIREKLAQKRILVRDCSNFYGLGRQYFRVAVGKRRQNKLFLNTLRRIMGL
jgi:threonine-phosphate decarboxylase